MILKETDTLCRVWTHDYTRYYCTGGNYYNCDGYSWTHANNYISCEGGELTVLPGCTPTDLPPTGWTYCTR
jgi:hypothetical protein